MNWMWIKKNQTLLITILVVVAIIAAGIPLWLYKSQQRSLANSEAYSKALQGLKKDDPASEKATRTALLNIDMGMAQLYAAHLSLKLGEADQAVKTYEAFLAKAAPKDSLRPLALMGLKAAYQALKQPEKVKSIETDLQKLGFSEK
ncbi:MAG: tetratricopeptide repeat protein [Myxococcaceae bacterium]